MALSPARTRAQNRASITLLALCISTALGIALASYIALCTRSMEFSKRLAQQEKANELAQIGLEEGLWALNQGNWTSSGPAGNTAWTISGANRTTSLTYTLPDPGATGQITLTIANYASTGPTWPSLTVNATVTIGSGQTFTRSVQATTQPAPLFGNAIASAESYVSFIGGGTVDSWNSDPDNDSSTPAVAYAFATGNSTNYNAVIAGCTDGTSNGVALTQAQVYGYVATTGLPVSYSTSGSPPGRVLGPSTASGVNVDTTRLGKSAFLPLSSVFSTTLPAVTGGSSGILAAVLNLINSLLSLPAGGGTIEYSGNLNLDGSILNLALTPSRLTITKPTKIIIDGDLTISATGNISVTSTGSLELYVAGNTTIGGGGIVNQTTQPKNVAIFSTSSSTTTPIVFNTTQSFSGVVFSPNNPIDVQQNATFYGALYSREYVRFSGSANNPIFHYDSSLRLARYSAVSTPYVLGQVTKL